MKKVKNLIFRKRSRKRLVIEVGIVLIIITALSLLVFLMPTQGATRTWDGEGLTNDWSDCDNWSDNTCPTASDIAAFDNTNDKDATIDASFGGSVAGVSILSGYDGTITAARSLTVGSDDFSQASGTWDGADQNLIVSSNGDFTVSGGTHTATTGTWTVERNFTHSSGTLTMTGATVIIDGSTSDDTTFSCSGTLGGSVTIAKTSGSAFFTLGSGCEIDATISSSLIEHLTVSGTLNMTGTFDVNGNLIVNNGGTVAYGGTDISIENSFTQNGTFNLSGITITFDGSSSDDTTLTCSGELGGSVVIAKTATSAFFTLESGCEIDATLSSSSIEHLTVNGTMNASGTFDLNNGPFIINSGGTVTYSGSAMTMERDFTQNGTFDLTGITITFDDSTTSDDSTITCTGSLGGTVNVAKSSGGDLTLASGCNITLGSTFDAANGLVTINGSASGGTNLTAEGSITIGASGSLSYSGVLTFDGSTTGDDTIFTCTGTHSDEIAIVKTISTADFTLASGCSITLDDSTDTSGSIFNSGTIDVPSGITINIEENFGSAGGTLTGTGTVEMDGSSFADDGTFACSGSFLGTVIVTKTAADAAVTVGSGCSITLGDATDTQGSITNNGTISISSGHDINVEESFLSASGVINNEGTIVLDGGNFSDDSNVSCNGNIGNLTVNKTNSDGTVTLLGDCTVGDLTRTDGPIANPGSAYILTIEGDLSTSTSDNFGGANLTLNFSGTNDQTITRTDTTISTPITVNKTAGTITQLSDITIPSLTITDGEFLNSTLALAVSGTLTVSDIFTQGSGTVTADAFTIGAGSIYQTTSTGDMVIGAGGVSNSGQMTIGTLGSCPGTDNISITSSSGGSQRSWTGSGTTRIYDASIQDQGGSAEIIAFSSTSVSGNGDNWNFIDGCTIQTRVGDGLRLGDGARLW